MSYLSQPTSLEDYGVVKVGTNLGVNDGVIYLNFTAGDGIKIANTQGEIIISSEGPNLISVYGTNTNYTATANDDYIGVNSANVTTITLPAGVDGRVYTIKNEANYGKVKVQPSNSEKIDNGAIYWANIAYQSVTCVFRAGQWRII